MTELAPAYLLNGARFWCELSQSLAASETALRNPVIGQPTALKMYSQKTSNSEFGVLTILKRDLRAPNTFSSIWCQKLTRFKMK
jgi:hypothetical protein